MKRFLAVLFVVLSPGLTFAGGNGPQVSEVRGFDGVAAVPTMTPQKVEDHKLVARISKDPKPVQVFSAKTGMAAACPRGFDCTAKKRFLIF